MGLTERLHRTRAHRQARAQGFEVAVGLPPRVDAVGDVGRPERECPSCGTEGHIDLVDVSAAQAHLTCPACGSTWTTVRQAHDSSR